MSFRGSEASLPATLSGFQHHPHDFCSIQSHNVGCGKDPGACFLGHNTPLREARGLTPWFSVEIKEKAGFPTPAKRVEKSGFRTENAITRLSRIRLTTIFKAEYITFRGASFWRGPENWEQSQFRDRYRILFFEAR